MSPDDRTTYSMGDSPVKPKVMRARSPVRMRIFSPRLEGKQFRKYWDYYPEGPGISSSPMRPRFDPCQVHGDVAESKLTRMTNTPASQSVSRSDVHPEALSTVETIQETVKMAVDSLVEAFSSQSSRYKLPAVQVPKYKTGADWRLFKAEFKQTMSMVDLKPSLQMAHLRQAVPEEAGKLLYQEQIESMERAFEVLTKLFGLINFDGRDP